MNSIRKLEYYVSYNFKPNIFILILYFLYLYGFNLFAKKDFP